jgi:POT family proton-dependent oligopeptide transporter
VIRAEGDQSINPSAEQKTQSPLQKPSDRWPYQINFIVGNEACERFSYYGMTSILAGYISGELAKGGLGQTPDTATSIIHTFKFVNYFMPLFGAWLSDRIVGRYHTILWVSLFYCAGHGVLACSDLATTIHSKLLVLFTGLGLIAFGSGGIKPCVSAFVGDQFGPDQNHLLQKAYGAFYWSINLGSFFSFLVIPWMKNHHGYSWAFAVPGVAMGLATLVFWSGTRYYVRKPPNRKTNTAGFFQIFWHAVANGKRSGQSFWERARDRFSADEIQSASSVGPILRIFALIPIFWALFDQTNSTWVLQGEKMTPMVLNLFGKTWTIGAEQMQSANPALVMILVPLLTLGLYPRVGKLATPLKRMSFGLFLTSASYIIVALIQKQIEGGAQLTVGLQTLPYFVLTTAEVLVSTTGLEFAFTQAAPSMKSTIMSFWLLTVAFGNLLVTAVTSLLSKPGAGGHSSSVSTSRFLLYAGATFTVAIMFSVVAAFYRYRNEGQEKPNA